MKNNQRLVLVFDKGRTIVEKCYIWGIRMDILRMGVEVLCGSVFLPLFLLLPVYYVQAPPSHSRHFPWSTLIVLCVLCLLLWTADFLTGFA